jgi:LysM repeat protein
VIVIMLATSACATSPGATPRGDAEQTRIAEGLRNIATAAPLATAPSQPSATPAAYPTAAPLTTATNVVIVTATSVPAAATGQHIVAAGDTLSTIAAKYNTSVAALQLENNLSDQTVRAGATLKLPTRKLADDENVFWFLHVVKAGETFGAIAQRYGVTDSELLRVNKLRDTSLLIIGQRLIIPVKQPARTSDASEADTVTAAVAPQPSVTPISAAQADAAITPIPIAPDLILLDTTPEALRPAVAPQPELHSPAAIAAPGDAPAMAAQLLALYNEQRTLQGLPPLAYSQVLQASAQAHANECASRGSCSHVGLDGSSSRDRIRRVGYTGRWTGENWAWSRAATGAFDMWFHQETPDGPHRKNIMSPNYSEVGFGIAAMNGGYVFIANLGG